MVGLAGGKTAASMPRRAAGSSARTCRRPRCRRRSRAARAVRGCGSEGARGRSEWVAAPLQARAEGARGQRSAEATRASRPQRPGVAGQRAGRVIEETMIASASRLPVACNHGLLDHTPRLARHTGWCQDNGWSGEACCSSAILPPTALSACAYVRRSEVSLSRPVAAGSEDMYEALGKSGVSHQLELYGRSFWPAPSAVRSSHHRGRS